MKFKFNKHVLVIAVLALGICLAITPLIVFNVRNQASSFARLTHSQQEIEQVEQVLSLMQDCETGSRGFVITGDEKFLEPYRRALNDLPGRLETIKQLSNEDRVQHDYAISLVSLVNEKIRLSRNTINTRRDKGYNEAIQLVTEGAGKKSMDSIRNLVAKILIYDHELLQQRKVEYQEALSHTSYVFLGIIVCCISMLLFFIRQLWIYFKEK